MVWLYVRHVPGARRHKISPAGVQFSLKGAGESVAARELNDM